jgi:6-phosphofructokinase 2
MTAIVTLTLNPAVDMSARIDHVIADRKLRCTDPRWDAGGGGVNVARVVHELGGDVKALLLAGGPNGARLHELLAGAGVPHETVPIAGATREDVTILEASSGRLFRFVMPGPTVAEDEWRRCLGRLEAMLSEGTYVVASGSLPPGAPADLYARLARVAQEHGARLLVDTSGAALVEVAKEPLFLLKCNLAELSELAGRTIEGDEHLEEAANAVVARGIEHVVVSMGSGGALLASRGAAPRRFPAITVRVVSKVGAGDSMVGGIVYSLARASNMSEAVALGMATGAAAVLAPGTQLCRREDVERIRAASPVR